MKTEVKKIRAVDLCCGAGGWAAAARGLPIEWVAVADVAEDCLETWAINHAEEHPNCKMLLADLATEEGRNVVHDSALGIDLVVGAIPCEQFSHARANRKLKDGELEGVHQLIDSMFSLIKFFRPRWWVFEDVVEVQGHLPLPLMWGAYECREIDASAYGPQKRKRLFIGSFPELAGPEPGARLLGDVLRPGPYRTLPNLGKYRRSKSKWFGGDVVRVQEPDKPGSVVISSQGGKGGRAERRAMVKVLDKDKPCPTVTNFSKGDAAATVEVPPTSRERPMKQEEPARAMVAYRRGEEMPIEIDPFSRHRPQNHHCPGRTVAGGHAGENTVENERCMLRTMEWQEAAIIQGFPTDYIFAASWSRTWKLVAQAIPVFVGRAILKGICDQHAKSVSTNGQAKQPKKKRGKR